VVTVGLAFTLAPVVALNPVPGLQEYVEAPLALSATELPEHTVGELTVTVGVGFTVTVVTAVAVHVAADVPVTV
jgi:hypothetical protein